MDSKEVCTISLSASYEGASSNGGGWFKDDDYTFYSDGRVFHEWDENDWSYGLTEWLSVADLSDGKKARFLEKASEANKPALQELFDLFS